MSSRHRPPNPSNSIVARTEGCPYAAKVWALCLVQGPFYAEIARFATCASLYGVAFVTTLITTRMTLVPLGWLPSRAASGAQAETLQARIRKEEEFREEQRKRAEDNAVKRKEKAERKKAEKAQKMLTEEEESEQVQQVRPAACETLSLSPAPPWRAAVE
jgi:apolipoprotein N-acyltransferase